MIGPSGDRCPEPGPTGAPASHRRVAGRPAILSRRALLGAGAVVAAGGMGAAIGALRPQRRAAVSPQAPVELREALAREESLIAGLDAALRGAPGEAASLRAARADHAAHAAALRSTVAAYPTPSGSDASPPPPVTVPSSARLRTAEIAAAHAAAAESGALSGAAAALLASISACEATHADLLA